MDEFEQPAESPDESLADVPPTPVQEPTRLTTVERVAGGVLLTAAGTGALVFVSALLTPAMGATRSSRLQWQERQQEMEEAERENNVIPQAGAESAPSAENTGDERAELD